MFPDATPSPLRLIHRPLIHRDLSWLQFNERVLEEARHTDNPLIERIKFLAITASNLDEFFMIRLSSIERSLANLRRKVHWEEYRKLSQIRSAILEAVGRFISHQSNTLEKLKRELEPNGIHLVYKAEPSSHEFALGRKIFEEQVLPKLPAPESFTVMQLHQLENLQTAAILPGGLWLRIPTSLPTVYWSTEANGNSHTYFFFLDDLLATHLRPGSGAAPITGLLRLSRDGDFTFDVEGEDPESIPDVIRTRLGTRERGKPMRLQHRGQFSKDFLGNCLSTLKLTTQHLFAINPTFYLHGLWSVVNQTKEMVVEGPSIRYPPLQSKIPEPFQQGPLIFEKIRKRDYLLHHPYDSFDAYVEWMRSACSDPLVESVEQTVYRIDALSPVIGFMKDAAKTKKVRVLIELRARFDELNNLRLADELQQAGVEVAYGFGKLKLHAKVTLITRNEGGEKRLYTHLSTGNYNAATARQYTDLAILTAHPEIGSDARHFFDCLFEGQIPQAFKQLVIAPTRLSRRLQSHIQAEAEAARAGRPARIVAKVNALVDEGIIDSLYRASQAGVQVDLIVRGACSLIPGIKDLSENIRVVSIVDRFLEHSRIYYFESSKKMYLSSADWMPRNFFSRLEIAFPVLDPRLYAHLEQVVIPAYLSDTSKARELNQHGQWKRRASRGQRVNIRSQVLFRELALHNYRGTPLEQ